jgi:hypothetical protein
LRAFWEKVLTLKDFETLGEVHCEFLNIGDRIKNGLKLQGDNPYFSQKHLGGVHSCAAPFTFATASTIEERQISSTTIFHLQI